MARILICSNFSGRYNDYFLGHDFINLFPSDSGDWNFYVPSRGCVSAEFGKGKEPDYLVMVDYVNGKYRLLGIANGLEYASDCYSSTDSKEVIKENKANGSITYFGHMLSEWFASQPNTLYVSFKLKEGGHVYMPSDGVFSGDGAASIGDIFVVLDGKHGLDDAIAIPGSWACKGNERRKLIGQKQRSYYDDARSPDAQKRLKDKLDDLIAKGLLCDVTHACRISKTTLKAKFGFISILDVVGKENSENVISHWLAEYLSDIDFYNFFASKFGLCKVAAGLDVKTEVSDDDRKRVDIAMDNGSELILIENKIQSPVHEATVSGKKISQLKAYLDSAIKNLADNGLSRKIKTYLLCPDYYEAYGYNGEPKLWDKSTWEPLHYSAIKGIVDDFMRTPRYLSRNPGEYEYLDEFSKSISVHANRRPESVRESILRKIAKKI